MRIKSVSVNNRSRSFSVVSDKGVYDYPYSKLSLKPSKKDPITKVYVDRELGSRGYTYVLKSSKEDSIMLDQVLEYNKEPEYMLNMIRYKLSVLAEKLAGKNGVRKREISRRMKTSPGQLYRLLKPENNSKTIDQLIKLFAALDCRVKIQVSKVGGKKQANGRSSERVLAKV